MAIADQPRILGLALAESLRRLRWQMLSKTVGSVNFSGAAPEQLVIAPPDLSTADPTVAQDIYSGIFFFAGHAIDSGGESPFRIIPPSEDWERELHSFSWLCHLGVAPGALSSNNARALMRDWLAVNSRPKDVIAWRPEVAAERLIAWLSHSIMMLESADQGFYKLFLRTIGIHIRHLRSNVAEAPAGMPQLTVRIALAYAAVCIHGQAAGEQSAIRNLDNDLTRQILPDGGHISRNPAHLPDILAWLLPLRQSFAMLGVAPSTEFISAIDRMFTALRFYRLGDGSFARFNGVSVTPRDLVATVLRYDDVHGAPSGEAAYSGYQRLTQGSVVAIMDTGRPAPGKVSRQSHAGCLSFEMSSGTSPIIVNCGKPALGSSEAVIAARSTAAHSTATVNDTSSCKFNPKGAIGRSIGNRIIAGPREVLSERRSDETSQMARASHDGYAKPFGIIHERSLKLHGEGRVLSGRDRFFSPNGGTPKKGANDEVAIRFHLHPSVKAEIAEDGLSVMLRTSSGEVWKFASTAIGPQLEESIYFASASGPKRTTQIVLHGRPAEDSDIGWSLELQ